MSHVEFTQHKELTVTYTTEDIERAYELGRMAERRKMNDLASITSPIPAATSKTPPIIHRATTASTPTPPKAPKVTRGVRKAAGPRTKGVKEAITAYLAGHAGVSIDEIVNTHGFKENSVRGTLMAMKKKGIVDQDGKFWQLANTGPSGNGGAEEAVYG
jgi:hypothetical protein